MAIERYISQEKYPHFTGSAKATNIDALTGTGEVEMWGSIGRSVSGALGQVAGAFAAIGQKQYEVEASLESAQAIGTLKQSVQDILGGIDGSTVEALRKEYGAERLDAGDFQKQLVAVADERLSNIYGDITAELPNEKARNIFEVYWEGTLRPSYNKVAENMISKKFTQHLAAEGWTAVELTAKAGDTKGAYEQIEKLTAVLTPVQKRQLKGNVAAWAIEGKAEVFSQNLFFKLPTEGVENKVAVLKTNIELVEGAMDDVRQSDLPGDEKAKLLSDGTTELNRREKELDTALEGQVDTLNDAFSENTLTHALIDQTDLPESEQTAWHSRVISAEKTRKITPDADTLLKLDDMADQIFTGETPWKDFRNAVNEAVDAGKIDKEK